MYDTHFRNFNHLLTTQPHSIRELFVSDLHLSDDEPALVQAFLAFLTDAAALPNLKKLYILGDWFEAWIGDDAYTELSETHKLTHWITPMVDALKQLRLQGCQTFVMHGNRDFLIRQHFCNEFSGLLINEPTTIFINKDNEVKTSIRLEHGDALCTDDKRYQKLRKYIRNPLIQWWLLRKPLKKRIHIANKMRNRSKQENAYKPQEIMDVNQQAVENAMHNNDVSFLIHGHTHRPAIHKLANGKIRYVLGDWRITKPQSSHEGVSAIIGAIYTENESQTFELVECRY